MWMGRIVLSPLSCPPGTLSIVPVLVLPGPQRDHIAARPRQPSDRDSRSSLPAKRPQLPLDVASTVTSTTARPRQQIDRRLPRTPSAFHHDHDRTPLVHGRRPRATVALGLPLIQACAHALPGW
jgi:hypothetical protein